MNYEQAYAIEHLGLDPDDNTALLEGFANGEDAVFWFLTDGWPHTERTPTDADRDALLAYVARGEDSRQWF